MRISVIEPTSSSRSQEVPRQPTGRSRRSALRQVVRLGLVAIVLMGSLPTRSAQASPDATPGAEPGSLVVYRRGANATVHVNVRVSGSDPAALPPNTSVRWDLPPGEYEITARSQTNLAKKKVRIESAQTSYLEVSFVIDFRAFRRVRISPRDEAQGAKAVQELGAQNRGTW